MADSIKDLNTVYDAFYDALRRHDWEVANHCLGAMHPAEIAQILESLPTEQREWVWELEGVAESEVLPYVVEGVRADFLEQMAPEEVAAATVDMDVDDAVDILQELPDDVLEKTLQAMDEQDRLRFSHALKYSEDTAGGLMNIDTVTVRPDVTLELVLRYLRRQTALSTKTDMLLVVNQENVFCGGLFLSDLLINDPECFVRDVMRTDIATIPVLMDVHEVAQLFEQRDFLSAPVLDAQYRLLGQITIDDVVDVIRAEGDHSLMSSAGLSVEDDLFAPVWVTAQYRAFWLGINLLTALLASWVIGLFSGTLEQIVALAVLMPVVASMGGIAGTQALTITIRGMAVGTVTANNAYSLLRKELLVGLLNGFVWAGVVAGVAALWFGNVYLGYVIGAAIVINLFFAALSGILLPLLLKRLAIDPALAGGVILTTVTDVVGFAAFLGLATLFLLH